MHFLLIFISSLGLSVCRDESEDEGFVINGDDIGVRLKAFEYWKCAESGVSTDDKTTGSVKFVIAESLPAQGT